MWVHDVRAERARLVRAAVEKERTSRCSSTLPSLRSPAHARLFLFSSSCSKNPVRGQRGPFIHARIFPECNALARARARLCMRVRACVRARGSRARVKRHGGEHDASDLSSISSISSWKTRRKCRAERNRETKSTSFDSSRNLFSES